MNPNTKSTRPYMIQDPDLYHMLSYGDSNQPYVAPPFGNWSSSPSMGCAGILTFLLSRALNIERLPWFADRRSAQIPKDLDADKLIAMLTPAKINAMTAELAALHENTQDWLAREGIQTISLRRSVYDYHETADGAGTLMARLNEAAKHLQKKSFFVEMDTLSSWGLSGYWRNNYRNIVDVTMDVPARDVAWLWHRIGQHAPGKDHMNTSESGEWVVVNRSMLGLVELQAGCVHERTASGKSATQKWLAQQIRSGQNLDAFLLKGSAFPRTEINSRPPAVVSQPWAQLTLKERVRRSWALLSERGNVKP